jgi:iron complex outermembrane receptor protein
VSFERGANISGTGNAVTAFIRGVGQTDFTLTTDPGVGIYLDGVYISRSIGALLSTTDVERIEIVRGPQGTFYGRNTTGGAILLRTVRPSADLGARGEITFGAFDRLDARAFVNLPLSNNLSVRASGARLRRDGHVRRLVDGTRMSDEDSIMSRFLVSFASNERFSALFSADFMRAREAGVGGTMLNANNQIVSLDPAAPPNFGFFFNLTQAGGQCGLPPLPPVPPVPNCFGAHFVTGNPRTTYAAGPNISNIDIWGASLHLRLQLGSVNLQSISAYRRLESFFYLDTDASPLTVSETQNRYAYSQLSQELQLSGNFADVEWIAGAFALRENGVDDNELRFSIADFRSGGRIGNESYAAFAHLTYRPTARWAFSIGNRITHDRKSFLPDQFIREDRTGGMLLQLSRQFIPPELNPNGDRILPNVERRASWTELTPSLSVSFLPNPSNMGYASYARGYKSGGFTQRVFPPEPETPAFNPEFVDSLELGWRTELLPGRFRISPTAFVSQYTDLQLIVNEGLAPKVRNAGRAQIWGLELEVEATPTPDVRVAASLGYIQARYLSVPASAAPLTTASRLPNTPKWTASVSLDAELWNDGNTTLGAHADVTYRSSYYKDANNTPEMLQRQFTLLNLNVSLSRGRWSLIAGISNLTNESYLLSGYSELAIQAGAYGVFSRPREWFIQGVYHF